MRIGADEFDADLVADVEAFVSLNNLAFDRWCEDTHPDAFVVRSVMTPLKVSPTRCCIATVVMRLNMERATLLVRAFKCLRSQWNRGGITAWMLRSARWLRIESVS